MRSLAEEIERARKPDFRSYEEQLCLLYGRYDELYRFAYGFLRAWDGGLGDQAMDDEAAKLRVVLESWYERPAAESNRAFRLRTPKSGYTEQARGANPNRSGETT